MGRVNLEHEMLKITLELYNNSHIPRNAVDAIVKLLITFLTVTYKTYINENLKLRKINNEDYLKNLEEIFVESKKIFDMLNSEYARFKIYIEKKLMIMPVEYVIGITHKEKMIQGQICMKKVNETGEYVPLKWSLKLLLELPGMFNLMINIDKRVTS